MAIPVVTPILIGMGQYVDWRRTEAIVISQETDEMEGEFFLSRFVFVGGGGGGGRKLGGGKKKGVDRLEEERGVGKEREEWGRGLMILFSIE